MRDSVLFAEIIACGLLPVSPLISCFLNSALHADTISSLIALVICDIILIFYSFHELNILSPLYRLLINDLWYKLSKHLAWEKLSETLNEESQILKFGNTKNPNNEAPEFLEDENHYKRK